MKYLSLLLFAFAVFTLGKSQIALNPVSPAVQVLEQNMDPTDFVQGKIMLAIKDDYRNYCQSNNINWGALNHILTNAGLLSMQRKFPLHEAPAREFDERGRKLVDLSLTFEIDIDPKSDLLEVCHKLIRLAPVEYAEPLFIYDLFYQPNDYFANSNKMYYLDEINAWQAWDVEKGDSSVAVGIIDTGTSFSHYELSDKVFYNFADPIDGLDNDGNGYIDDYRGWDFASNGSGQDNDPTFVGTGPGMDHGVLCTGPVAAKTDNNSGIASIGFNTRFFPVKAAPDNSLSIWKGYDGVVYCADMGIPIVNLSWGGSFLSNYGKNVCNYAAINKNVLIVAAGGNTPVNIKFYPASFENVIGVAGTMAGRKVWSTPSGGTSYNNAIDICAPAFKVRTTAKHTSIWGGATGTSLASPIVCAIAALVKAKYPAYDNAQLRARLLGTGQDIYSKNPQPQYQGNLGAGLINAYSALTSVTPGIAMNSATLKNLTGTTVMGTDTLEVSASLSNLLDPTLSLELNIIPADTSLLEVIQNGKQALGVVSTMGIFQIQPALLKVKKSVNQPTNVLITLHFSDSTLQYYHDLKVTVTIFPNHQDITDNKLHTTINSKGRLGLNLFSDGFGLGIDHDHQGNRTYACSFMAGINNNQVVDGAYDGPMGNFDNDFQTVTATQKASINGVAGTVYYNRFDDHNAGSERINLTIDQRIYALTDSASENALILEYTLTNDSSAPIQGLYTGIFSHMDWNTYNGSVIYDQNEQMVYSFGNVSYPNQYIGYVLINSSKAGAGVGHYSNTFFDGQKKFSQLYSPGWNGQLNNLNPYHTMGCGPDTLLPNATHKVVFAMVAGSSPLELKQAAQQAREDYFCKIVGSAPLPLQALYEMCPGDTVTVQLDSSYQNLDWGLPINGPVANFSQPGTYSVKGKDLHGCPVIGSLQISNYPSPTVSLPVSIQTCDSAILVAGPATQTYLWNNGNTGPTTMANSSGLYSVQVANQFGCIVQGQSQVNVTPLAPQMVLSDTTPNVGDLVIANETSGNTTNWQWNFGDSPNWISGKAATHNYAQEGSYMIQMVASNGVCSDTLSNPVYVSKPKLTNLDNLFEEEPSLYPNPSSGQFFINYPNTAGLESPTWKVSDSQGKTIQTGQLDATGVTSFDLDLPSGFYMVQIANSEKSHTQRVVIQ